MFLLKRAEALMKDISLSKVTKEKMPLFRKMLAVQLYKWGKIKVRREYESDLEIN